VLRLWETHNGGRVLTLQEGSTKAPPRRVPLREVLAWADRQLSTTKWARVDKLVADRGAAIIDAYPDNFWRSRDTRRDEENARIDDGHRRITAAERELNRLVQAALAENRPRAGEQLELFGTLPTLEQ
jgi:hypothetical protein